MEKLDDLSVLRAVILTETLGYDLQPLIFTLVNKFIKYKSQFYINNFIYSLIQFKVSKVLFQCSKEYFFLDKKKKIYHLNASIK